MFLKELFLKVNFEKKVSSGQQKHKSTQHAKSCNKPVLSGHSKKRPKTGFQDRLWHNASQKYCRMLQREHSAILLTLPFSIKTIILSIFKWPLKTGFTVPKESMHLSG